MEPKKAYRVSVVLVGVGIILLILPLFQTAESKSEAALFAGLVCILSAFIVRQMGEK